MAPRSQPRIERSLEVTPTGVKAAITHIDKLRRGREVSLELHHHYSSKIFYPGSVVSGDLVVAPTRHLEDVAIQISFVGKSQVQREDVQGRQTTSHNFLKLDMPLPDSSYPQSGDMQSGTSYRIPFSFTVPLQLLPSACPRKDDLDGVSDHHLQLPPTMGGWEKDDMSPELTRISYAVTASVYQGASSRKIMGASKSVNVLGSIFEDPPLNITKKDENYKMKRTKKVRNGLLSRSLGRITATADQPTAFYLESDGRVANQSEAIVNLFFEPSAPGIAPPEIETVSAKIRAYTWYSGTPMQTLPNFGPGRGAFSMTVPVKTESVTDASWALSLSKLDELDYKKQSLTTQRKAVNVRFTLPASKKTFLPTFHSCLISRAYTMELKLKIGSQNVNLALPVQIVNGIASVFDDENDVLPKFEDL